MNTKNTMTTENQPARMGDAYLAQAFREYHDNFPNNYRPAKQWIVARARELSAHGGDGDGVILHRTDCDYNGGCAVCRPTTQQPASGEFGPIGDADLDAAREPNPFANQPQARGEGQDWFAECRRVLEDISTEMRAAGRGDERFQRLINCMPPALATKQPASGEVVPGGFVLMPKDMNSEQMAAMQSAWNKLPYGCASAVMFDALYKAAVAGVKP